jgi:hypothetical protein
MPRPSYTVGYPLAHCTTDYHGRSMFVVIAPAGLAVALQKRIPTNGRIVLFRDTDALAAWNTIMTRQPTVIALDPRFVDTSRGAALIARARAAPSLSAASFRVLTLDDDEQTVRLLQDCHDAPEAAILSVSRPLDRCGSRAAPRFPIVAGARALVNGEPIQVVDLSTSGIRLVSPIRLRPAEEFRLALILDDKPVLRLRAVTAWSTLQSFGTGLAYRAGAQFVGVDPERLTPYCQGADLSADPVFTIPDISVLPS